MLKDDIRNKLDAMREKLAPATNRGNNKDPALYTMFFWQEVSAYADAELKKAAKALTDDDLVPGDAQLRAHEEGEHTILSGAKFAFCIKVSAPRETFDKDDFLVTAPRHFRIAADKLKAFVDLCVKKSAAPLSKRVMEI